MLSCLVAANELRVAVPAAFLSLSMVPFASISLAMGAASWILPKKAFIWMDNILYTSYMRTCLFIFENVPAMKVNFYGDYFFLIKRRESAVVLSNHQSNVDWAVINTLANRQDRGEVMLRVMVKEAIQYVPLFGWYIFQHGYIYVRRFRRFILAPVQRQLQYLAGLGEPFWLLIFPEGTRFSSNKNSQIKSTQDLCRSYRLQPFDSVLFPRAGGFALAIEHLRGSLDAVYDVTIGYGQSRQAGWMKRAPDMFRFVCDGCREPSTLYVHIRRFSITEIPVDREALKTWLIERYRIKNAMLEDFYAGKDFPELVVQNAPAVPFFVTLPPTLFFLGALIAPCFNATVRKIYLGTVCFSPFLLVWMKLRGYA